MEIFDNCPDEDAVLLLTSNNATRMSYKKIDFESLSDSYCKEHFRFDKSAILELCQHLRLPDKYTCPNRTSCSGLEGLLILLRRLTYPNRLLELVKEFGRSKSELSLIVNTVLEDIHDRFAYKLTDLNQPWMDLNRFSQASLDKGSLFPNCWGYIDGTTLYICRPSEMQRTCFSGHKRQHCLKFQGLVTPCGLFAHLYGPIEGSRHDSYLLQESGLLEDLQTERYENYVLFGDAAYPITPQLMCPYRGATDDERAFNKTMSKLRQCVEWEFGKTKT